MPFCQDRAFQHRTEQFCASAEGKLQTVALRRLVDKICRVGRARDEDRLCADLIAGLETIVENRRWQLAIEQTDIWTETSNGFTSCANGVIDERLVPQPCDKPFQEEFDFRINCDHKDRCHDEASVSREVSAFAEADAL